MSSPIPGRVLVYLGDFASGLFSNPFSRGKGPGTRGVMTARDLGKSIQTAVLVVAFGYLLGIVQALQSAPPDWVPTGLVPVFLTLVATLARSLSQLDKHLHDDPGTPPGPPGPDGMALPFPGADSTWNPLRDHAIKYGEEIRNTESEPEQRRPTTPSEPAGTRAA